MKSRDLDTSKELEAAQEEEEEEAVMETKKKIRKDTELEICSKEWADAAVKEDEGAGAEERKKFCTDCRTTKTPLWRVGPSGPKSLCNACGIRYRKKTPLASNRGSQSHQQTDKEKNSMKMSLVILGNDCFLEATTSEGKKQRRLRKRKLREEEIAAASLVALSCASLFA